MTKLMIVVGSTRPGRVGLPTARWIEGVAAGRGKFESIDFADLAEIGLPFLDEPKHPRLREYEHEHTWRWSSRVEAVGAFIMVTPEYNFGMPAPLKNAIDFLHHEWAYKPVAFVSYGGLSGGTRSVQMTKQVVTAVRMFPIFEAVSVPFVNQFLDRGVVQPNETMVAAANAMIDELARVAEATRGLRADQEAAV